MKELLESETVVYTYYPSMHIFRCACVKSIRISAYLAAASHLLLGSYFDVWVWRRSYSLVTVIRELLHALVRCARVDKSIYCRV